MKIKVLNERTSLVMDRVYIRGINIRAFHQRHISIRSTAIWNRPLCVMYYYTLFSHISHIEPMLKRVISTDMATVESVH